MSCSDKNEMNNYIAYLKYGVDQIIEKIRNRDFVKEDGDSKLYVVYLSGGKLFIEVNRINDISNWSQILAAHYADPTTNTVSKKREKWRIDDKDVGFVLVEGFSFVQPDINLYYSFSPSPEHTFSHELAHHYFFNEVYKSLSHLYFKADELREQAMLSRETIRESREKRAHNLYDIERELEKIKDDLRYAMRSLQRKLFFEEEVHATTSSLLYLLHRMKEDTCARKFVADEINKLLYYYRYYSGIRDAHSRISEDLRVIVYIFDYFEEKSKLWNYTKNFIENPYSREVIEDAELAMSELWNKIVSALERSKEEVQRHRFNSDLEEKIYRLEKELIREI